MFEGLVEAIFSGPVPGEPMKPVDEAQLVAGRGIVGDRYFQGEGTFSGGPSDGRALTLIEAEAIEAVRAESGLELDYPDPRRNVLTRGVPLNHLVGREFTVGEVRLRGVKLCEPCRHLQELNGKPLINALLHRAGLRADVLSDGAIRPGDRIAEA